MVWNLFGEWAKIGNLSQSYKHAELVNGNRKYILYLCGMYVIVPS